MCFVFVHSYQATTTWANDWAAWVFKYPKGTGGSSSSNTKCSENNASSPTHPTLFHLAPNPSLIEALGCILGASAIANTSAAAASTAEDGVGAENGAVDATPPAGSCAHYIDSTSSNSRIQTLESRRGTRGGGGSSSTSIHVISDSDWEWGVSTCVALLLIVLLMMMMMMMLLLMMVVVVVPLMPTNCIDHDRSHYQVLIIADSLNCKNMDVR
jgi:hypothetical protein